MKKVINGKMYDTEKAKEMGYACSNVGANDFYFWEETLYQKRTGEFFIYGSGNAASKYAESCGQNEWRGGDKIIPLSYQSAQKWAEDNLDGDDYESIFGEVSEDESKVAVTLSLNGGVYEMAKREAYRAGITISDYIEHKIKE